MDSILHTNDTTIYVEQELQVFAYSPSASSYIWVPSDYLNCTDCDTTISAPGSDITYVIQVTDSLGCVHSENLSIMVVQPPIFIPTGFSPNGDGNNDFLFVRGLE